MRYDESVVVVFVFVLGLDDKGGRRLHNCTNLDNPRATLAGPNDCKTTTSKSIIGGCVYNIVEQPHKSSSCFTILAAASSLSTEEDNNPKHFLSLCEKLSQNILVIVSSCKSRCRFADIERIPVILSTMGTSKIVH